MDNQGKRSPARGQPGIGGIEHSQALDPDYTPPRTYHATWERWATDVDVRRLTARQTVVLLLVRCGIARTPEQALRLLGRDSP